MSTPQGPAQDDQPGRNDPPAWGAPPAGGWGAPQGDEADAATREVPRPAPGSGSDQAGGAPDEGRTAVVPLPPVPGRTAAAGSETRAWNPSEVPPPGALPGAQPPAQPGEAHGVPPWAQQPGQPPAQPSAAPHDATSVFPAGHQAPPPGAPPQNYGGQGYGGNQGYANQPYGAPQGGQYGAPGQQQPYGQPQQYGPQYPPGPQPGQPYGAGAPWGPPPGGGPSGKAGRRRLPLILIGVLVLVAVVVLVLGFLWPGWWRTTVFDQAALQEGVTQVLAQDYGYPGVGGVVCGDPAAGPILVQEGATFECTAVIDGATVVVPVRITGGDGSYEVSRPAL